MQTMLSPSVKTKYLEMFQFSGNLGKTNQSNLNKTNAPRLHNTPCKCFLAFSGNFIIRFSGSEFLKDYSGHHSVKGHVWEKVYLLSYGSKSYRPIRLHDFWECSISLTTCLFRMIQILSPFLLVCQNLRRYAQQFFKFECLESCLVDVKLQPVAEHFVTSCFHELFLFSHC